MFLYVVLNVGFVFGLFSLANLFILNPFLICKPAFVAQIMLKVMGYACFYFLFLIVQLQ